MSTLQQLASAAKTQNEADYGSDRQVDAENLFFDTLIQAMPSEFGPDSDFNADCVAELQSEQSFRTSDECIDKAMIIVNKLK